MRFVRGLVLFLAVFCVAAVPAPDDEGQDLLFIQQMWSYATMILPGLQYKRPSEQFAFMCAKLPVNDVNGCLTDAWSLGRKFEEINTGISALTGTKKDRAMKKKLSQGIFVLQQDITVWWKKYFLH